MTTYGQHDDQATRYDPEETQRFTFPAQRAQDDGRAHDESPDEQVFSQERQYDRYGGTNWGAGFFGAVVTVSVGAVLSAAVAAAATVLGATPEGLRASAADSPQAVLVGTVAVLLGLLVASCYAGGYVAGRMSRFDGGRQGFASWLTTVAMVALTGGLVYLMVQPPAVGELPRPDGSPLAWGAGAAAVLLLGSVLAAVAGGKVGRQYHQKVDDAGYL